MTFRPYQDAEMSCVCELLFIPGLNYSVIRLFFRPLRKGRGTEVTEGYKEIKLSIPYKEPPFYYLSCMNSIVVAFLC